MNRKLLLVPLMACMALLLMGSAPLRLAPNHARVQSDQAIARAVNQWTPIPNGYRLQHPRHTVDFTEEGLHLAPRHSSLTWDWQLTHLGTESAVLAQVDLGRVHPANETVSAVTYRRGAIVEQYIAQKQSIEQRFVIPEPLALGGADLVVAGAVRSEGAFETLSDGWVWRAEAGSVRLGGVRVYDAKGTALPATMTVTAEATRIVVDGAALGGAAYPVTIDPEIGTNDLRISFMGKDTLYDAFWPAVAYNSQDDEYLVVWYADDNGGTLADDEFEIYAQLINAATGARIGSNLRISDMGPDGNANWDALNPAVAYDSTDNQYLVVWQGDDNTAPLADDEFEIYGQRLTANGVGTGANDFRISDMGPDGNAAFDAQRPAVAYNSTNNEYLVVWYGDDNTGTLVDEENEIYSQRLNAATGAEVGTNDVRLSSMGDTGDANYDAYSPAVAYNSHDNQYLVVWSGDDNVAPLVEGENEIFGQRLDGAGSGIGANDFRISDMGPDGNTAYAAYLPDVAYNSTNNEYLVVWYGDDNTGSLVNEEYEIYGQRLTAAGAATGTNDFRISSMGPDGDIAYSADYPAVTYNSTANEYLVVWRGVDNTPPLVAGEREVFGQRLTAAGAETGSDDFRISDMGGDGNNGYTPYEPAVAYGSHDNQYLVVWRGDDDMAPLVHGENEVFGQQLSAAGDSLGTNDFRLSFMGDDTSANARGSDVAYNSHDNEYLVVWYGDDGYTPLVDNENEIWGQRVDAETGALISSALRISTMGPNGNAAYNAYWPAVAYNSTNNQYLVVWYGDTDSGGLVDNEYEIWGQRINASTGALILLNFRISDMGDTDGSTAYSASAPDVAYNSASNEYLVVWQGDDEPGSLVDGEFEIFGQRLTAAGAETGTNDFRISDMGPASDTNYGAYEPAVAYNSTNHEYLVVWRGDDNTAPLVNDEYEIFGQLLTAAGVHTDSNDFRISDMGPDGNTNYNAYSPAVAYNSHDNQFLVVWEGDDNSGSLVDEEFEIYGQRLTADGVQTGSNDLRLSTMGGVGNANYDAVNPAVTYDSHSNEYLVVWEGDNNTGLLADGENETWGQRINATTGASVGTNDFRLSDMGPDGGTAFDAAFPAVAYSSVDGTYLVVWQGNDNTTPLVSTEIEIFGQRFSSALDLFLPLITR